VEHVGPEVGRLNVTDEERAERMRELMQALAHPRLRRDIVGPNLLPLYDAARTPVGMRALPDTGEPEQ
jgi:hypothetical protein